MDYSRHGIRDRTTVYADQHDMGMSAEDRKKRLDLSVDWWLDIEKEFNKLII